MSNSDLLKMVSIGEFKLIINQEISSKEDLNAQGIPRMLIKVHLSENNIDFRKMNFRAFY